MAFKYGDSVLTTLERVKWVILNKLPGYKILFPIQLPRSATNIVSLRARYVDRVTADQQIRLNGTANHT
jgi:hypothetical protein